MKIINIVFSIILVLGLLPKSVDSQQWQLAEHAGGAGNDQATCIATDSHGNIYFGGAYEWTATFQNQNIGSNGLGDFFLAKYNPACNLIWIKHGGGSGSTLNTCGDAIGRIIIDGQDRLFVAGTFDGIANFGSHSLTCNGTMDAFIARYDTAGNCLWVRHAGGQYRTGARALVLDNSNHVYLTGVTSYTDSLHCTGTSIAMNNHGFFMAKFDFDGNLKWIRSIEGNGNMNINEIVLFGDEIILAGSFKGDILCDTIAFTTQKMLQAVLLKMDTTGAFTWGKTFECTTLSTISSVLFSNSGSLYCTGWAQGTYIVGNDTLAEGGGFAMKLNSSGDPVWMKRLATMVEDACLDSNSNLFISGVFMGEQSFSDCQANSTGNMPSMYIAKLDTNGNCIGLTTVANVGGTYMSMVDEYDQFYIAGFCAATEFGSVSVGNYGEMDAFWAKLDYVSGMQGPPGGQENELSIYANPNTGVFHVKIPQAVSKERSLLLRVFDNSNRLVQEQALDMGEATPRLHIYRARPGMYHLQLIARDRVYSGKMIVQ